MKNKRSQSFKIWGSIFSLCLLSGVTIPSHASQKQEIDWTKVHGIPFLQTIKLDRKAVEDSIQESFMKQLKRLMSYTTWPDYSEWKAHKAIAIKYIKPKVNYFAPYLYRQQYIDSYIDYWGGALEEETLEEARKNAITRCSQGGSGCVVFLENDELLTSQFVDDHIAVRQAYIEQAKVNLELAEKSLLIDKALAMIDAETTPIEANISFSAGRPLKVGYPDYQQDFASICQERVFYALVKTDAISEKKALSDLALIERSKLYGHYNRSVNTIKDFTSSQPGRRMEKMLRFISHYFYDSKPSEKDIYLPKNLKDALSNEIIEEIWVEGSVRVTSKNNPLVISDFAKPLAIRTNKGFYLGLEIRMPEDAGILGCDVRIPFSQKVIDISGCNKNRICAEKVLSTLFSSIKQKLKSDPFLATEIRNEVFAPGEFVMERQFKPSKLIKRPLYERSTYTVQAWGADSERPSTGLSHRQEYMGVNKDNVRFLFLKVRHILTYSTHKNGSYTEPDDDQTINLYKTEVGKAVDEAIKDACKELRGIIQGSLCVTPRWEGEKDDY